VVLAHGYLGRVARTESQGRRAEWPWIAAMVGYTMTSLWLLASRSFRRASRANPMAPLHASLSLWTWQWDPTVLAATLALAGGYTWLIRGRGRVSTWSPLARVYFAGGLLALFLALESPIDVGGDKFLFSFHMLQHLLLAMVVPPFSSSACGRMSAPSTGSASRRWRPASSSIWCSPSGTYRFSTKPRSAMNQFTSWNTSRSWRPACSSGGRCSCRRDAPAA